MSFQLALIFYGIIATMPSKKKNTSKKPQRNPLNQREEPQDLIGRVITATLVSSVIAILFATFTTANAPQGSGINYFQYYQFLPPFLGVVGAVTARKVKEFFNASGGVNLFAGLNGAVITTLVCLVIYSVVL